MQSFVRLYSESKTPQTLHQSGNIIIEADADSRASTSCSAVIYQGTNDLPFQAIAAAIYKDKFEKRGKDWIITERKMRLNFIGDMRHHLLRETST